MHDPPIKIKFGMKEHITVSPSRAKSHPYRRSGGNRESKNAKLGQICSLLPTEHTECIDQRKVWHGLACRRFTAVEC